MSNEITIRFIETNQGDWAGLYLNDVLHEQGHVINLADFIMAIEGMTILGCSCVTVSDEYFEQYTDLPERFRDIPGHCLDC